MFKLLILLFINIICSSTEIWQTKFVCMCKNQVFLSYFTLYFQNYKEAWKSFLKVLSGTIYLQKSVTYGVCLTSRLPKIWLFSHKWAGFSAVVNVTITKVWLHIISNFCYILSYYIKISRNQAIVSTIKLR